VLYTRSIILEMDEWMTLMQRPLNILYFWSWVASVI